MSKWLIVEIDDCGTYDYAYCDTREEADAFVEQKNENAKELAKQYEICMDCYSDKPLCDNPKYHNERTAEEECENNPDCWEAYTTYAVREIESLEEVENE